MPALETRTWRRQCNTCSSSTPTRSRFKRCPRGSASRPWPPTAPTPRRCSKAGVLRGGNRLRPTAGGDHGARRRRQDRRCSTAPMPRRKEQLGGYYLIDVPDLDAALSWAARCPGASHGVDRGPADLADVERTRCARDGDRHAARAAEAVARRSYGKLVAFLAARTRDVAAAEDALADAFAAALADWPRSGVPAQPRGLAADGRAAQADRSRRRRPRTRRAPPPSSCRLARRAAPDEAADDTAIPDQRLAPDVRLRPSGDRRAASARR